MQINKWSGQRYSIAMLQYITKRAKNNFIRNTSYGFKGSECFLKTRVELLKIWPWSHRRISGYTI